MKFSEFNLLDFGHKIQLAGALYSDGEHDYVVPFPDESCTSDTIHGVLEMTQDDWAALLRQTDLLETEILQQAEDKTLTKAIIRKSMRQIEQNVSWNVFRRDHYTCRYCGRNDVPLTVDHLVTWESGGSSVEANLLSSCKKDNKVRGELTYEEWLKHPHYLRVSQNLDPDVRELNFSILSTLDSIPRRVHQRSR